MQPGRSTPCSIERLVAELAARRFRAVFNPWSDVDREHDLGPDAPAIRRQQLRAYLAARRVSARYLIVGEAMGYQGGHFTGVPLTSERILLGRHPSIRLEPREIIPEAAPRRTSRPEVSPSGFTEPTATMVWRAVLASRWPPRHFVFWNAFPWHPYRPEQGLMSNRRPRPDELWYGREPLSLLLRILPVVSVIAMGRTAENLLQECGIRAAAIRHPSRGGAAEFRAQLSGILGGERPDLAGTPP